MPKGTRVMEVPACQEDAEGVPQVEAPETWGAWLRIVSRGRQG